MAVERVEHAALGLAVRVPLVGEQIERDLDREHRHHPLALAGWHPLPLLGRGRTRIFGVEDAGSAKDWATARA